MTHTNFYQNFIHRCRFLAAALVGCVWLLVSALSVEAAETTGTCGKDLTWSFSNGTLTISGSGRMTDFTDSKLAPWFDWKEDITALVIEDGVTGIGDYAFTDCINLARVSLGNTLEDIGVCAFERCKALTSVTFPESLLSIDFHAFMGCKSLNSVKIPYYCDDLGKGIFAYCSGLVRATIEAPISVLPSWMFYECTSLTSVSFPIGMTNIGEDALENCDSLTEAFYNGTENTANNLKEQIKEETGKDITVTKGEIPKKTDTVVTQPNSVPGVSQGSSTVTPSTGIGQGSATVSPSTGTGQGSTGSTAVADKQIIRDVVEQDNSSVSAEVTLIPEGAASLITNVPAKELIVETEAIPNLPGSVTLPADSGSKSKDLYQVFLHVIIENMDGWQEVINRVAEYAAYDERMSDAGTYVDTAQITVEMRGDTKVSAKFMQTLAGRNARITFYNPSGTVWMVDCKELDASLIEKDFILDYTVESLKDPTAAQRRAVGYKVSHTLSFTSDVDFKFYVQIPVGHSFARYNATLYHKDGKNWNQLQVIVVDGAGKSEFYFDGVKKKTDYMFALDIKSAYSSEAIIPEALKNEYGGLVDEYGTKYVITGTNSSWGMSGIQVTLILVSVILGTTIVVGIVVGIISRKKYASLDAQYYLEQAKEGN